MKQKKYINILILIMLVFSIVLSVFSSVIKFVITDKKIYVKLLEKSNTYAVVQEHLYAKMDSILGNDISSDLKKSIITEDDIKREADKVLDCMISNIIYGQTNIPDIDTSVYNIRVAEALASLTGYEVNIGDNKNITYIEDINSYLTPLSNKTIVKTEKEYMQNMVYNHTMDQEIVINEIASRAELEAQGRAMLKSMGYTEEEARKKLAEKGLSESDVWNYLESNGYLDEEDNASNSEQESDSSQNQNEEKSNTNYEDSNNYNISDYKNNENINQSSIDDESQKQENETAVSKKKIQNIVMSVISDNTMNFEEKMNALASKLVEEAQNIIGIEIQKLNLSEIINSDIFKTAVKITSFLYNIFYVSLVIIFGLFALVLLLNREIISNAVSVIANSLFISGGMLSLIFGSIYLLKLYEKFYINFNKAYFEPMFLASCDYFSKGLFILSGLIFLLGLLIKVQVMIKRLTRR